MESWGLKVVVGKTIGPELNQLAGPDELRAQDFQEMLDNPNIKAIWGAKGGYGTVRIVDRIDFSRFRKKPKWVIGFSDMTVLHSHINNMGIATMHAIMGVSGVERATCGSHRELPSGFVWRRPARITRVDFHPSVIS